MGHWLVQLALAARRWRGQAGSRYLRGARWMNGYWRQSLEALFLFRLHRSENELGQKTQVADIAIIEAVSFGRAHFDPSHHASPPAQRHCDRRRRVQSA